MRRIVVGSVVAVVAAVLSAGGPVRVGVPGGTIGSAYAESPPEKKLPPKPDDPTWKPLFDGKSLDGWKTSDFLNGGKVEVKDGAIVINRARRMSGFTYDKKDFPKMNYEVSLEAKKTDGDDFFGTTTFPIGDGFCSLVVGGWGGSTVGISSINGADASENTTNSSKEFAKNKWYRIRIRVTADLLECWIDDDKVVDLKSKNLNFSTRIECDPSKPFGIATYNTAGMVRDIKVRTFPAPKADAPKK